MIVNAKYIPSHEQIDAILVFLPVFEREDFVPSKLQVPPNSLPYHDFAGELTRFHEAVHDNGFVFSFDWSAWEHQAHRYFEQPGLLLKANLQVLRKLITFHVRKQRFCDGHLPEMVKCGHIAALLRRLKELRDA
jgi:hypothetical protein